MPHREGVRADPVQAAPRGCARRYGHGLYQASGTGGGDPCAEPLTRLPDWPERLATLITAAEHRPFDAARWNCGRFAMAAVVACVGQRPAWQHRRTLAEMADTAGFSRVPVPFARTGDVMLAADPDRLGVVLDAGRVAFVGPAGLLRAPITTYAVAWRIGW